MIRCGGFSILWKVVFVRNFGIGSGGNGLGGRVRANGSLGGNFWNKEKEKTIESTGIVGLSGYSPMVMVHQWRWGGRGVGVGKFIK